MLEVAILLPLLLAFIGFVFWMATTLNAQASLSSAMVNALRLAATRGTLIRPTEPGGTTSEGTIDPDYLWGSGTPPPIFYSNLDAADPGPITESDAGDNLNQMVGSAYQDESMVAAPREYQYAAIYLNQALKLSLGGTMIFPCRPPALDVPVSSLPPGCVSCRFVDPFPYLGEDPQPFPGFDTTPDANISDDPSTSLFLLQCRYVTADVLSRLFRGLLGFVGVEPSQLVIERSHFVRVGFKPN
jgi:hypothetical protein